MDVFIVGSMAVLIAGFIQGSLGFGFGMISVPPMLMVLTATEVIPMQIALSLFVTVPLAVRERSHLKPMLVGPLLIGAILGLPIGMLLLNRYDGPYVKLAVGIILISMSTAMLNGWSHHVKRQLPVLFPIGFLSGIMSTSISMAGPPIILFLTNQDMEKSQFRGNILVYFAVLSIVTTISFVYEGLYTARLLTMIAIFLPTTMIGGFIGQRVADTIPQLTFRRITLFVALIMGILLIVRNGFALLT